MVLVTMSCKRFYEIYLACYENIKPGKIVFMLDNKDSQVFPLEETYYTKAPPCFLECTFKKIKRIKIYE